MLNPWALTTQEVREQTVVARSADGQTVEIPKQAIFGTPKVGQELRCVATAPGNEEAAEAAFAQRIVNELLGKG